MAENFSILLDKQSSTLHRPLFPSYREHLLSKLKPLYEKAYEYYIGTNESQLSFSQQRFLTCHNKALFAREKSTGFVRVLSRSCHLRFCPICNRAKENIIRRNVSDWLQKQRYPKFLTLTMKNCTENLRDEIDRLYSCFQQLRRLKLIKKRVGAGIWFFQITRSKDHTSWHPHLHCLLTGGCIPIGTLRREWERLTGDSMIVNIKMIRDLDKAACEVARYSARSCSILKLDMMEIFELDEALRKRRICGTWGKAHKQRLTSPPKYKSEEWSIIGSWSAVTNCMNTDKSARAIFDAWEKQEPLADSIAVNYLDTFARGLSPPADVNIEQKQYDLNFYGKKDVEVDV